MTVYTEIGVIRANVKALKSKLNSFQREEKKVGKNEKDSLPQKSDSVKNTNIEKEILTYKADGTIERIALENKHIIDVLG